MGAGIDTADFGAGGSTVRGLLTRDQAAEWLGGIHPRTVDRLTRSGDLAAVKIGKRVLYRQETLEGYARSRERKGA